MEARLAACVLLYLAAACSSDSGTDNNNPSAVAYAGTFGSPTHSGTLVFATAPAAIHATGSMQASLAVIDLVGTLTFSNGSTLNLTGTLDGADLFLDATGYNFVGTLSGGVISGTFSGPSGESGSFSATLSSDNASVSLFCGNYSGTDAGVFSLALTPDLTGGVIVVPSDNSGGLTGRATPTGAANTVQIKPDVAPTTVIATGVIAPIGSTGFDTISGAWNTGSDNGTFGGSTRCQ
ncbi:MAG: hypothetical protein U0133_02565 [Gemmatimonadales bacterium]